MLTGYNLNTLKELVTYMNLRKIYELDIKQKNERISIKRKRAKKRTPATAEKATAPKPAEGKIHAGKEITAPMSGIFYSAPGPGEDPFVKEEMEIVPGQTLCIIEAMKMMNEIKAESAGRIGKVLVSDGEPVTSGQIVFLIIPKGEP